MAEITVDTTASPASTIPDFNTIPGLVAGEDISQPGLALYIKSDGKWWLSTGAANNAAAKVDGWSTRAAKAGEPIAPARNGTRFQYATGKNPGVRLYLSGTVAGGLADATSTGGLLAIAKVIDANRIEVETQF